jgi:hypothetical protein
MTCLGHVVQGRWVLNGCFFPLTSPLLLRHETRMLPAPRWLANPNRGGSHFPHDVPWGLDSLYHVQTNVSVRSLSNIWGIRIHSACKGALQGNGCIIDKNVTLKCPKWQNQLKAMSICQCEHYSKFMSIFCHQIYGLSTVAVSRVFTHPFCYLHTGSLFNIVLTAGK